ncbi:MAG: dipeptidase [Candidatus Sericytochromatia bacterium]|nr:dipeptidase [Candidatus Tanganyikabacteria bacterium]
MTTPKARSYHDLAVDLHNRVPVVDGHADTLDRSLEEGVALGPAQPMLHIDVPRMKAAGVNLQVLSLWVPPDLKGERALRRAMAMAACFHAARRADPDVRLVASVADVDVARPGFVLSFEGAEPLADDPHLLDAWYALGLRMIALTWNGRNGFADGLTVGDRPSGITGLGQDLLRRMRDLGVVLDLAHIAEAGFWHALELTEGPVVVSHANARALCSHPRNMTDDQLRAIAGRGGLVGACVVPKFLGEEAALEDVARHVLHMVEIAGADHVGLGCDFDGVTSLPRGVAGIQDLPALTALLLERGLAEEDMAKILGGNWLRVFGQVWM